MYLNYDWKDGGRAFNKKVRCINKMYSNGVCSRDTEASWYHVALKFQNTCTNKLASSILFGCLSPSFCTISSKQKLKKNLWFSWWWLPAWASLCRLLFCATSQKVFDFFLIRFENLKISLTVAHVFFS